MVFSNSLTAVRNFVEIGCLPKRYGGETDARASALMHTHTQMWTC
jgi:hypothetical protein